MTKGRPVVYSFSFSHHGRYSSYHRLLHYLEGKCDTVDASFRLPSWLPHRVASAVHYRWFRCNEWRLRSRFRAGPPRCVHYLYPENSLFHGGAWKGAHKLVLSCHQPLARPGTGGAASSSFPGITAADCLVLLAQSTVEEYRRVAPQARIEVIPHGVDTDFFRPGAVATGPPLILTVGNWLRDYTCWAETVRRVAARKPEVEFGVVANPATLALARQKLGSCPARVHYWSGLTDQELVETYRRAQVAFVPLHDAIANNAILEALAMGLPLVASDLPAVREYAGDAALWFHNTDPAGAADTLAALLENPGERARLAARARQRAESNFAWERIADRLLELYRDLIPADSGPAARPQPR